MVDLLASGAVVAFLLTLIFVVGNHMA